MRFDRGRRPATPRTARGGVVTSLAARGTDGGRIAVSIDGEFAFEVSAALVAEAGLRKDEFLSEERQTALLHEDEPYFARESALRMLARRDRCEHEIVEALLRRSVSRDVVEQTLEWVRERGYVDDRRFATAYATDRRRAGWGRQRIVLELIKRGIAREAAADALGECIPEGGAGYLDEVTELVRRRFAVQLRDDPEGARPRIVGFLTRRGHDWDSVASVLRAVMKESVLVDRDS